jgi:hypothetical protein
MVFSLKVIEINKTKKASREDVIEERFNIVRAIKRIARSSSEKLAFIGQELFIYFLFRPFAPVLTSSVSMKDGHYTGQLNKRLQPHGFGCKFSLPGCVYQAGPGPSRGAGMGPFPSQKICAYEGWWLNGAMHGKCIYETTDGCVYRGYMQDNKKHGKGTFTWADGSEYCGDFSEDHMDGQGVHSFPTGRKYEGGFVKGKKHGRGKLWLNSVESSAVDMVYYEGDFQYGRRSGTCKQVYSDGTVYEGEVILEKKQGIGKMLWPDSSAYYGNWLNDFRHGKGRQTRPNGSEYQGVWHKNSFQHRE